MASEGGVFIDHSFQASSTLSASQYSLVALSSSNQIALSVSSTNGALATVGVLQNDPVLNQAGKVRLFGKTKVTASSSGIVFGVPLGTSTSGGAITALSTGLYIWGFALETVAAAVPYQIEAFVAPRGVFMGSTA